MQITIRKISFKSFNFETIITILAILVSKSLYYETFGQNKLLILILGLTLLYVLYKSLKNEFLISKKSILFYLLIVFIIFINPNKAMSTSLVFTLGLTISLFFTSIVPLSHFTTIFYKSVKFIMIASLFRYLIIFTNAPSILPDFISITGEHFSNYIFFGIQNYRGTMLDLIRNNGLWWEPGAFQVIINLAFILGLVFNKVSKKDYFLFLFVLLTTFSTAGIAIFSILSFIYFRKNMNYKLILLFLILVVPVFALSTFYETVIESKMSLDHGSSISRFNDATLALRMFSAHPFIGTGMGNLEILNSFTSKYDYGTGSNGILTLLANLGLLSFVIFIQVFYPGYLKKLNKKYEKILVSLSLFLLFFSQNFTIILIFPILIFYGAKKYKHSNSIDIENEKR
jgi:hypothetical protein